MRRDSTSFERRAVSTAVLAAAVGAALVAALQLRHGIVHLLDTVTYWSGAEAVASGRPFTTRLAPSFSNFDALEFLDRGGRLPFVDFPVGYPLVAGSLGAVIGVRAAMHLLVIVAISAVAALIVIGDRRLGVGGLQKSRLVWMASFGVALAAWPTMRLVTQGALSESLFCASALGLVIALARYREGGRWWPVAVLSIAVSLLRFIGAPLALLAGWEMYRRSGNRARSLATSAFLMLPAAINIFLASLNGGGHNAGWRGIDRVDLEVFARSVGGWFDSRQGDIRRTYFTTEGPSWWSWFVALVWIGTLVVVAIGYVRGRSRLPATSQIALAAATVITSGLVAGMMGFDALVIADNRLMLPSGVLTLAALVWATPTSRRIFGAAVVASMLWLVVAVDPSNLLERFSDDESLSSYSQAASELDVSIVITNDADGVHWDTGLPAAYAPTPVKMLTGEQVDIAPIYGRLPCSLAKANGAVVVSDRAMFFAVDLELLDDEVDSGRLTRSERSGAVVYLPTESACD